jgi:hypothetical protein
LKSHDADARNGYAEEEKQLTQLKVQQSYRGQEYTNLFLHFEKVPF